MKPYVIMSPDFDVTSGGIRVMWGLFGWLLAKGQEAYINRRPEGEIIAIYPEIVHGNPANANTVVRYILNKPGVMSSNGIAGPTEFNKNDKIYVFSKLFDVWGVNKSNLLFLPILNMNVFKDQHKKRTKTCYFVGKGTDKKLHPEDSILIDRPLARDQQHLADILNECQVMYCYDPVTAMTEISRLCGCRVIMINDHYTKQEFSEYEAGMNGISWGVDENVPLNVAGFRVHYGTMKRTFNDKINDFIEDTQK